MDRVYALSCSQNSSDGSSATNEATTFHVLFGPGDSTMGGAVDLAFPGDNAGKTSPLDPRFNSGEFGVLSVLQPPNYLQRKLTQGANTTSQGAHEFCCLDGGEPYHHGPRLMRLLYRRC